MARQPLPPSARKESLIAFPTSTIEGRIEGGSAASASPASSMADVPTFQGDQDDGGGGGEGGRQLTGGVRAPDKVIDRRRTRRAMSSRRRSSDLQQTGVVVGDIKAGTLTVAAGARPALAPPNSAGGRQGSEAFEARRLKPRR
jgi:hypothetical protein